MSFHLTSTNLLLSSTDGHHFLTATCTPSTDPSTLNLDTILGNTDGCFVWGSNNLTKTARNITLEGTTLKADLRRCDGTWTSARVELAEGIANLGGKLAFVGVGVAKEKAGTKGKEEATLKEENKPKKKRSKIPKMLAMPNLLRTIQPKATLTTGVTTTTRGLGNDGNILSYSTELIRPKSPTPSEATIQPEPADTIPSEAPVKPDSASATVLPSAAAPPATTIKPEPVNATPSEAPVKSDSESATVSPTAAPATTTTSPPTAPEAPCFINYDPFVGFNTNRRTSSPLLGGHIRSPIPSRAVSPRAIGDIMEHSLAEALAGGSLNGVTAALQSEELDRNDGSITPQAAHKNWSLADVEGEERERKLDQMLNELTRLDDMLDQLSAMTEQEKNVMVDRMLSPVQAEFPRAGIMVDSVTSPGLGATSLPEPRTMVDNMCSPGMEGLRSPEIRVNMVDSMTSPAPRGMADGMVSPAMAQNRTPVIDRSLSPGLADCVISPLMLSPILSPLLLSPRMAPVQANSLDAVLLCRDLLKAEIDTVRSAISSPTVGTFPSMLGVGMGSSGTQTEAEVVVGTTTGPTIEVTERSDSLITVSTSCLSPAVPAEDVSDEHGVSASASCPSPVISVSSTAMSSTPPAEPVAIPVSATVLSPVHAALDTAAMPASNDSDVISASTTSHSPIASVADAALSPILKSVDAGVATTPEGRESVITIASSCIQDTSRSATPTPEARILLPADCLAESVQTILIPRVETADTIMEGFFEGQGRHSTISVDSDITIRTAPATWTQSKPAGEENGKTKEESLFENDEEADVVIVSGEAVESVPQTIPGGFPSEESSDEQASMRVLSPRPMTESTSPSVAGDRNESEVGASESHTTALVSRSTSPIPGAASYADLARSLGFTLIQAADYIQNQSSSSSSTPTDTNENKNTKTYFQVPGLVALSTTNTQSNTKNSTTATASLLGGLLSFHVDVLKPIPRPDGSSPLTAGLARTVGWVLEGTRSRSTSASTSSIDDEEASPPVGLKSRVTTLFDTPVVGASVLGDTAKVVAKAEAIGRSAEAEVQWEGVRDKVVQGSAGGWVRGVEKGIRVVREVRGS